jgi:hypothetical protein
LDDRDHLNRFGAWLFSQGGIRVEQGAANGRLRATFRQTDR